MNRILHKTAKTLMSRERPKTALLSLRLMGIRDMDILIMGRPKTLLLSRILMLGKPHLP